MNLLDLYEGREPHQQAIDKLEQRRIADLEARMDDCARRGDVAGFRKAKEERDSYHTIKTNEAELDEKLKGLPAKKLGSARDLGKSVKKFRAQRGLDEGEMKRAMEKDAERMSREKFCAKYGNEDWVCEFWDNVNGPMDESGIGHDIADKKEKIARATPQSKAGAVASTVKNAAKWLAGKGGPGKEGPTYEAAQKKNSEKVEEEKARDLAAAVMLKKAHAAFPSAKDATEALALWIADKEQRDVNRLERENEQEEEMIARIIDQLKSKDLDEHGGGGGGPRQWHAYVRAHRADEGWQDFNKVEPYAVCLAGKPVKKFDYYEEARKFHDNWKKKLYREGNKEKADKITLMPILDELDVSTLKSYADKRGAQVAAMKADNPNPVPGSKEWVKAAIPAQQVARAKQKIARAERQQDANEAVNPAQQAAIAIAMKKAGKKPKTDEAEDKPGLLAKAKDWLDTQQIKKYRKDRLPMPAGGRLANARAMFQKMAQDPKKVNEAGTAGLEDTIRRLMAPAYEEETGGMFSYTLEKKAPTMARLRKEYSDDLNDIFYNATPEELHQAAQELKDMYGKVEQGVAEAEDQVDPIILKALERLQPGLEGSQLYSAAKEALALEFGLMKVRGDSTFVHYLNQLRDMYSQRHSVKEDIGSWIVYDPETKQIRKRFKTHTAGKSYAKVHGLGFASSEYYFDNIKPAVTAEGITDYQKRRQRERDVDMGKPVAKQRTPKQTDYQKRRAEQKRQDELGEEKTRLDPKCWKGKKIGTPKTKMKGGVRVNNCVPAEEGMFSTLGEDNEARDAVESAIIRRILVAHKDLLQKFGPQKVMDAAAAIADDHSDVEEIGTSDISAYVHEVERYLAMNY